MSQYTDSWSQENFEDYVETALIAMYESKVHKIRKQGKFMTGNEKDILKIRKSGAYIPGYDRLIVGETNHGKGLYGYYDRENDGLLPSGCIGLFREKSSDDIPGYFDITYFEKCPELPKHWIRRSKGPIYKAINIVYQDNGIFTRKTYSTLWDDKLNLCDVNFNWQNRYGKNESLSWIETEKKLKDEHEFSLSVAMQYSADHRFCWSIKAEEDNAKVTVGCQKEEIKSLLYARSLPLSETGRKRPILHLVEAHKRRIKNGTDIDITAFLRGTQTVEINNTTFTVLPPPVLAERVSKKSQQYFQP